jgi:membrane protein DedA with SNARE-associated domain
VIIVATAAVLGDRIGYGVVRWGGRRLVVRISRRIGGEAKIRKAEALAKRRRTDHPGAKNSQPNPGAFLSEIVQY